MKALRNVIAFLLLQVTFLSHAYEIVGYAPAYVGEKVTLYTYQDYITMTRMKLGEGQVSAKDSLFHIDLKVGTTIQGIIEIGNTEAPLYLAPNTSYDIYFPKVQGQPISFQNQYTDIVFFGLDTTDINYRILQYNLWFDTYIAYHEREIARGQFMAYLDTFMIYAADAYKDVQDEYFITYVRYNIGELQQSFGGNSKGANRMGTYINFIEPFPVYYENDQYMRFFKSFYSKDFSDYPPDMLAEINMAIYNASPTRLMTALKKDIFLSKPEIREMVMINQLGKQYYERNDTKRPVLMMLDSIANHAKFMVNATIAKNVITYLTSLEPGFPAPVIDLEIAPDNDEHITWKKYEGKFVYLNFFETWNDQSIKEMRIMADLRRDYGPYVEFLSVCTDKKREDFDKYMKENPDYDWDIVYVGSDSPMKEDYKVQNVPTYFLIDQSGFIAMAPAPTPAPDGEYESIDKTFFYIKRALTQTDGKRVGER
ncbi:MAG: TlpA disulfide reductase family protein [Crocinitomicaceae bacterium]|nr:TlpA family protein disulfide reductase [Crocinitomicaceae bacterium]